MKYLTHYTEQAHTELLNKTGAFFAFSNAQFHRARKEGVAYVTVTAGLLCPKDTAQELVSGLDDIHREDIKADVIYAIGIDEAKLKVYNKYKAKFTKALKAA